MFEFIKKLFTRVDANQDGRVDAKDVKIAVESVAAKVKTAGGQIKKTGKAGDGAARAKIARARKSKPKA